MKLRGIALCALGVMAGCGGTPDVGGTPTEAPPVDEPEQVRARPVAKTDGAAALANVEENLARLEALDVFQVGELLVELPEEASACYGMPCPGSETAIQDAKEAAALRLEDLVEIAEQAVNAPSGYLCTELVDENLDALRALEIVEVVGMVEAVPENDPQCYNLPCQDDIEAANAENQLRAAQLDSIARGSQGL